VRALAALAALLLAGQSHATPRATPPRSTRVTVEVFVVALAAGDAAQVVFTRREGRLEGGANPDVRARDLATGETELILLNHSTSWRWETDGRIVLTYLVWASAGSLRAAARPLPSLQPPAPTDPLRPRRAQIRESDVLAHGLRHLAFLLAVDRDGAVADALGPRAAAALAKLAPDVAGELRPH